MMEICPWFDSMARPIFLEVWDARPLKKKPVSSPTEGKPIFDAAGKQIGSKVAFGDIYRYYDNQGKRIGRMQAKKMGLLN